MPPSENATCNYHCQQRTLGSFPFLPHLPIILFSPTAGPPGCDWELGIPIPMSPVVYSPLKDGVGFRSTHQLPAADIVSALPTSWYPFPFLPVFLSFLFVSPHLLLASLLSPPLSFLPLLPSSPCSCLSSQFHHLVRYIYLSFHLFNAYILSDGCQSVLGIQSEMSPCGLKTQSPAGGTNLGSCEPSGGRAGGTGPHASFESHVHPSFLAPCDVKSGLQVPITVHIAVLPGPAHNDGLEPSFFNLSLKLYGHIGIEVTGTVP